MENKEEPQKQENDNQSTHFYSYSICQYLFQALLYYDSLFVRFYLVFELILLFIKNYGGLLYNPVNFILEVIMLFAFFPCQLIRHHFGNTANRSEMSQLVIFFIILSLLVTLLYIYFLRLQVYVLHIEFIINWFGIVILALQVLFSIPTFKQYKNYEIENK